jgi:hypothetical protein
LRRTYASGLSQAGHWGERTDEAERERAEANAHGGEGLEGVSVCNSALPFWAGPTCTTKRKAASCGRVSVPGSAPYSALEMLMPNLDIDPFYALVQRCIAPYCQA